MNRTAGNRAGNDALPEALLQTVGVMSNIVRSMGYVEKQLSELAKLNDLDPQLRREVQHLRGTMTGVSSEVMFRLSLVGTTVTDLLKEAQKGRCSDPTPVGETSGGPGRASRAPNRLGIAREVPKRP